MNANNQTSHHCQLWYYDNRIGILTILRFCLMDVIWPEEKPDFYDDFLDSTRKCFRWNTIFFPFLFASFPHICTENMKRTLLNIYISIVIVKDSPIRTISNDHNETQKHSIRIKTSLETFDFIHTIFELDKSNTQKNNRGCTQ